MTRTRLRQLEQIRSSLGNTDGYHSAYDDNLNMGIGSEVQPGENIGSGFTSVSFAAPDTIIVSGNVATLGVNPADVVTLTGGTNTGITGTIATLSYSSGLDQTTFVIADRSADLTTETSALTTIQVTADDDKNLLRDLNLIRTQLRKLNQTDDWFDEPTADAALKYELALGSTLSSDTLTLSGAETFTAGTPYTMKVFLNGQLQLASVVSGTTVITAHDYVEQLTGTASEANANQIKFNFTINANDLIQLRWYK